MKTIYKAALLTVTLAMGSCSKEAMFDDGTGTMGHITKPGVEVNNAETVYQGAMTRASYDISGYLLDFYHNGETTPYMSKKYNELGSTIDLPSGEWTISVRSHELKSADWDSPYFTGSSEKFTVETEKITTVEAINCTFASIKVTVAFGEKLLASMSDVTVTVKAGKDGQLSFASTESRAGYFAADGATTMEVAFSGYINGNKEEFTHPLSDVAAGQWRKIFFGTDSELPVPDDPTGSVVVGEDVNNGISINIGYTDVDLDGATDPGKEEVIDKGEINPGTKPEIVDPEDPGNGGEDPVEPTPGEDDDPITFSGTLYDGIKVTGSELLDKGGYTVDIKVLNKIADVLVEIQSEDGLTPSTLTGVGLTNKFSLVNPGEFEEKIIGLGFPVKDNVLGQENIHVDITQFMEPGLLKALNGGNNTNTFILTVSDQVGNVKALTFTIYESN